MISYRVMRNSSIVFSILFVSATFNPAFAQLEPIDSIAYKFKIQELQRKLTFTYYSPDDGKWWINRFTYNESTKRVSLKNIKAKNPNSINSKEYKERLFSFSDLNPFSIALESVKESQGRMVKGKSISIKTYDRKPSVANTLNGNAGTPATFLLISIPSYLDDSMKSYSDSVFTLLKQITFKAACFSELNPDQGTSKTYEALLGNHVFGNDSVGWANRKTVALSPSILQYIESNDSQFVATGYFILDHGAKLLKEIRIENDLSVIENDFQITVNHNKIIGSDISKKTIFILLGTHYGFFEKSGQVKELRKTL